MTDCKTSVEESLGAATNDNDTNEDNETNELIRNAYRVIDSVYRDLDGRSPLRASTNNSNVSAQTPPRRPLDDQKKDLDTVVLDGSNEDRSSSLNSNSTSDDVIETFNDVIETSDDVIETSNCTPLRRSTFDIYTDREIEDDVIIVSSNLSDIVDLCTPVLEVPIRRRRRTPSYQQNRNLLNFISRPNSPSFSPVLHTTPVTPSNRAAELPVASRSAGDATNERSVLICPVCMESSVKQKPTSTKCGHVFCETCIKKAVSHTKKCPMCNTKLTDRMLFRIYL